MADTDIVFTGLFYLDNQLVSCAIAGLDCGDYTVRSGQITVPLASNPALSSTYIARVAALALDGPSICPVTLADVTYRIPVVIGRAYTLQAQMLRPMTQDDLKSKTGPGLGKRRRAHHYSFLFSEAFMGQGTGAFSVGTDFTKTYKVILREADYQTTWPDTSPFAGVHWDALNDASTFDTMLCWTMSRPLPLVITASAVHLASEDR